MKAKKFKINTWLNYEYDNSRHEINSGEIITVPDQSFTVDEIIQKFTRGIPLNIGFDAQYSDTDDFDEVDERSMIIDLTDIQEADERIINRKNKKMSKAKDLPPNGALDTNLSDPKQV